MEMRESRVTRPRRDATRVTQAIHQASSTEKVLGNNLSKAALYLKFLEPILRRKNESG